MAPEEKFLICLVSELPVSPQCHKHKRSNVKSLMQALYIRRHSHGRMWMRACEVFAVAILGGWKKLFFAIIIILNYYYFYSLLFVLILYIVDRPKTPNCKEI